MNKKAETEFSLESLFDIALLLTTDLDFNKTASSVVVSALSLSNAQLGMLYIKKPFEINYHLCFYKGIEKKEGLLEPFQILSPQNAFIQEVEKQEQPFFYQETPNSVFETIHPTFVVPLKAQEQLLGFLLLGQKYYGSYTQEDVLFLKKFALIATHSLKNALLYSLTSLDPQTGLYLKSYFSHRLKEKIYDYTRYQEKFSLVLIHLDFLENIVKSYDFKATTFILEQTGKIILNFIRETDLPCRFKENQIIIILPDTSEAGAMLFAQRLYNSLKEEPYLYQNKNLPIDFSVGVAEYSQTIAEKEILEQVQKALSLTYEDQENKVCAYSDYLRKKE